MTMTRYFEILQRDGAARIGKLLLKNEIHTPYVLNTMDLRDIDNGPILDGGSMWSSVDPETAPERLRQLRGRCGEDVMIILPHLSYPPAAPDDEVQKALPEYDHPPGGAIGTTLRPGQSIAKSDMYVMEGAGCFENKARDMIRGLLAMKETIPADTAVYVPDLALPENAAMLAYLGVDVVDTTRAIVSAYNDIYLTSAGSHYLDSMTELPCRCRHCADLDINELRSMEKKERARILEGHNVDALEAEMALARERIRAGTLREYVEGSCRNRPWLTALLRLLDTEYNYMEERAPIVRSSDMIATTGESLTRPEVVRFATRVHERYSPPEADVLVLLPCSAKKPYSISNSHYRFINAMGKYRKYVHEVIITSPLGIVPRELELTYPAANYDTTVTGYWDAEERRWVQGCLEQYLTKHTYSHIVAHVDGAYRDICEVVSEKLGIEFTYTCQDGVTSPVSLGTLKRTLANLTVGARKRHDPRQDLMRSIADYQFGSGAGKLIVPDGVTIKAPFPKHQVFLDKEQIATLVPQYGIIALTIAGARRLLSEGRYVVTIDDFVPKGSILAPGITGADPQIRPNDEVIVTGKRVLCIGRALMGGREMQESSRGIAVDLRHVKKIN